MDKEQEERFMQTVDPSTMAMLNQSEIDTQIAAAARKPRSVSAFLKEAVSMVTLTEEVAGDCIYALPRKKKDPETGKTQNIVIEGPSARFAEIIAYGWTNCRAISRVSNEAAQFITAQAVFWDIERTVIIGAEVQRRIVDKYGRRFNADMIQVTAAAASSIALRNAILRGIPRALWQSVYEAARRASVGDQKALANKRADAMKAFAIYGISQQQLLERLNRQGIEDVTIDDLRTLRGMLTSLRDGDVTPEGLMEEGEPSASEKASKINEEIKATKPATKPPPKPQEPEPKAPQKPPAEQAPKDGELRLEKPVEDVGLEASLADRLRSAKDGDQYNEALDLLRSVKDPAARARLETIARAKRGELA
jgi:hypothetical protein